jgi:hypothetical protein
MGSDAEPEAMAGRINYRNRHMTVGSLATEYEFTALRVHNSRPGATSWRQRPISSPTSLTSDDTAL